MGYTSGIKWDEELIEKEIKRVMEALSINRMPSCQEMQFVRNDTALINAVRRHGGYDYWADKLNLKIKDSETKMGKLYEELLKRQLEEMGYNVTRMSIKHPYDLLVNDCVKVDVKASKRFHYSESGYYYTFNLEKLYPTCDIYVCYCLSDDYTVEKQLIIPSKLLRVTQLSLGENSIYDKFIDKFEYIQRYDELYKTIF